LANDLTRNAEKVMTPLIIAADIVLANDRLKIEAAIIAIPAAIVLRGSQLLIACDILSFMFKCNRL
jgi:hypothetical protein